MNGNGRRQNRGSPWDGIAPGQLSDAQLRSVGAELVRRDSGETAIEYASVTLHVGEVVWRLSGREARREALGVGKETEIGPGELVTIVTDERVTLPAFVAGHIFPKGRLAGIGLICQPTTIDPGYDQYLRVNVMNVGAARLRLPRGLGIAKMELIRLPVPVERPYASSEDPRAHYPRNDHAFADESLVKDAFRLEHMEERVTNLERASERTTLRLQRTVAGLLLIAVVEAVALLRQPFGTWIRNLPDAQARGLFVSVVGGVVLAGALSTFRRIYRQRRSVGEWLAMILHQPVTPKDKAVK